MMKQYYRRINRILRWLPVLWNDFEGDWVYILKIWSFKLKLSAASMRKYKIIADYEQTAVTMDLCREALERLIEDDYAKEEWEAHRSRFPWRNLIPLEGGLLAQEPMRDGEIASFMAVHEIEEAQRKADERKFTDIFLAHYRDWWD